MAKHGFIFSNKPSYRFSRHLVFWIVYTFICALQSIGDPLTGFFSVKVIERALICTACLLPFCIISVYVFINFLFPYCIVKQKYFAFVTGFVVLVALGLWIDYYALSFFLKFSGKDLTPGQILMVDYNFAWPGLIAGALALGIKLAKTRYLQQNENLILAKQKASTELKLLKAHIQPDFLFGALDDIYRKITSGSRNSPLMIMKLSEILSYLLYESDQDSVPLERELTVTNDFITISKLTIGDKPLSVKIIGNANNIFIPPKLLLSNLQNSFAKLVREKKESGKVVIIISIQDTLLMQGLTIHYSNSTENMLCELKSFKESEQRRLNLLYPMNDCVLGWKFQDNKAEVNLIISLNSREPSSENSRSKILQKEIYETL